VSLLAGKVRGKAPSSSSDDALNDVSLRASAGRTGSAVPQHTKSDELVASTKLLTCGVFTSANLNASSLKMSGYLLRQSRRNATQWAKEWCVLHEGDLQFFESKEAEAANKSPSVVMELDAYISFRVNPSNTPGKLTSIFELVDTQRSYIMMASTPEEMESWLQSLTRAQSVRKCAESKSLRFSGALIKVRHGTAKTRWCTLIGRTLFYSKGAGLGPLGSIRLRYSNTCASVTASTPDSDDDNDDTVLGPKQGHQGITVSTKMRGIHHFLCTVRVLRRHFALEGWH
jgi:hypothetical protein